MTTSNQTFEEGLALSLSLLLSAAPLRDFFRDLTRRFSAQEVSSIVIGPFELSTTIVGVSRPFTNGGSTGGHSDPGLDESEADDSWAASFFDFLAGVAISSRESGKERGLKKSGMDDFLFAAFAREIVVVSEETEKTYLG